MFFFKRFRQRFHNFIRINAAAVSNLKKDWRIHQRACKGGYIENIVFMTLNRDYDAIKASMYQLLFERINFVTGNGIEQKSGRIRWKELL